MPLVRARSIDPRAPEVAGILRDAYFNISGVIPRHEIQQKTQFGYENNESSSELFYVNRAEISDSLGRGVNLRDAGIGLIGRIKLGGGFRLEDAISKPKNRDYFVRFGISGARGDILDSGRRRPDRSGR